MKKFLIFVLLVVSLCHTSIAFCEGTLSERDAFDTYMGNTLSEVKRIAPRLEQVNDLMYSVDYGLNSHGINILIVLVEDDTVFSVGLINTGFSYDRDDLQKSLAENMEYLGIDSSQTLFYNITNDPDYIESLSFINDLENKSSMAGFTKKAICVLAMDEESEIVICIPPTSDMEGYDDFFNDNSNSSSENAQAKTAKSKDIIMTLEETKYQGDMLIATFLIENISKESIYINSLYFDAKDGNYERLSTSLFNCPGSSISGNLDANDKVRGNVCFEKATNKPIKISYSPSLWSSEVLSFIVE